MLRAISQFPKIMDDLLHVWSLIIPDLILLMNFSGRDFQLVMQFTQWVNHSSLST